MGTSTLCALASPTNNGVALTGPSRPAARTLVKPSSASNSLYQGAMPESEPFAPCKTDCLNARKLDPPPVRSRFATPLRSRQLAVAPLRRLFARIRSGISRSVRRSNRRNSAKPMQPTSRREIKSRRINGPIRTANPANPRVEALPRTQDPSQPGFLNSALEHRLVPRDVKGCFMVICFLLSIGRVPATDATPRAPKPHHRSNHTGSHAGIVQLASTEDRNADQIASLDLQAIHEWPIRCGQ